MTLSDIEIKKAREVDMMKLIMALEISHKKESGHLKIICPMHEERVGSMAVYSDHVFCFGCMYKNDVLGFIQDIYQVSFPDAVRMLNSIK